MSKVRSLLAVLGLVLVTGIAFAMPPMESMPPGGKGGSMTMMMHHHFFMHSAVPMLLPLAEMHSYALHLSDHQAGALAIWRNRHMREAIPLMKRLHSDKSALRKGLLDGVDKGALHDIMNRLDTDRAHMLDLEVAQVRIVHQTLSPSQWQKLLTMYQRMQKMGFGMMHR